MIFSLGVQSRIVAVYRFVTIRRMLYGTVSSRQRHGYARHPSFHTAIVSFERGAEPGTWNQRQDSREVAEAGACRRCPDGPERVALVELADEVGQELSTCLGKWQVAKFVQNQEVQAGDQVCCAALPFGASLRIKLVHQIDQVEEPAAATVSYTGAGDADGKVGFA